jgi:hypothetical protein
MHSLIFHGNGSVALDDLWFGNLTSTLPILNIKTEAEIVRVSWPFSFFSWTLEYTEVLDSPIAWTLSNHLTDFNGDELSVRFPKESPVPRFFRLTRNSP